MDAMTQPGAGLTAGLTAPPRFRVRPIEVDDLRIALRQGWDDYRAKRGDMLFLGLIYPVVGVLAFAFIFGAAFAPLAFPLAAGISLAGPALASGFYELARRRELGEDPSWGDAFSVLKNPPLAAIAGITALVGVLFGLWMLSALAIYAATLGLDAPLPAAAFWDRLFSTPQGWALIVVGNLVGFMFALVVLVISVISFPMLVDRRAGPLEAVVTSVRAVRASPRTFAIWGLMVAGLLVLGSIPLFVGLAVVLPVLGYATWHLYTRVVER